MRFVLNHEGTTQVVALEGRWRDLVSGEEQAGQRAFAPYDVRLLIAGKESET